LERLSAYSILIIKRMTYTVGTRLSTQMGCCIVDGLSTRRWF
jgi:hypothetical protein